MQLMPLPLKRRAFFDRTFFERLFIYLFLSHLLTKLVFELGLGYWHFQTGKQQQLIFYGLIVLDYVITWRRFISIKFDANHITLFAVFCAFIGLNGAAIGFLNSNPLFETLNDTAPLMVMSLNILRIQSERSQLTDETLSRLLQEITVLAVASCVTGLLATALGKLSTPALDAVALAAYGALFVALTIRTKGVSRATNIGFLIILALTIASLNRSSLVFFSIAGLLLLGRMFLKSPPASLAALVLIAIVSAATWTALPDEAGIKTRLYAMTNLDADAASRRTSVGERETEFKSIRQRLALAGHTIDLLGLGHGALYEMHFAHHYKKAYGHAHFSWALFKLRYGSFGYVLAAALAGMLLYNALIHVPSRDALSLYIVLISLSCLIYMFTYVNFIFLLSGLAFVSKHKARRQGSAHRSRYPDLHLQSRYGI
jgi:hypothetical protein